MFESRCHLRNRFIINAHLFCRLFPLRDRSANFFFNSLCLVRLKAKLLRDLQGQFQVAEKLLRHHFDDKCLSCFSSQVAGEARVSEKLIASGLLAYVFIAPK
jgi:hypothetical protein